MKKENKTKLMKKGWSAEEVNKAENIIEERKLHDKSRSMLRLDRILFWGILFLMAVGNALVAFVLIPMLLVFNKLIMNIFVIVVGFSIGLLFNFLIWDIEEHLTKKHHLIAAFSIPILALFNLYFIVKASNAINILFDISEVKGDPLTVSALYVIAFLIPYLWTLFVKKKIKKY